MQVASVLITAAAAAPAVDVPGLGSLIGAHMFNGSATQNSTSVAGFLGVPYAQAPIGDLRWRPPVPFGGWDGPRAAGTYGSRCMQALDSDFLPTYPGNTSEDCLFLNIFTPDSVLNSSKNLPVMFWIHGGAYNAGQSDDYPGDELVYASEESVVVVTINYRLNVFGFLGSDDLRSRAADRSTGNYGMQDQRLALTWVKNNIAAFGGNGSDITIFGESAGGNSVINHLTQPASFGMYTKAIIESGTYVGFIDNATAESTYTKLKKSAQCNDVDCLLGLSADALFAQAVGSNPLASFGPVSDGVALTDDNLELISRGEFNNVPLMMGSNRDEAAYFFDISPLNTVLALPHNMGRIRLAAFATLLVGLKSNKVLDLYSPSNYDYPEDLGEYSQQWWEAMRISTDGVPGLGACGVRNTSQRLHKHEVSLYTYQFGHAPRSAVPAIVTSGTGTVPHGSEIAFVFGSAHAMEDEAEKALALQMAKYWSNFAKTGNPNSDGLTVWPAYDPSEDAVLQFRANDEGGIRVVQRFRQAQCDFWETTKQSIPIGSPSPEQAMEPLAV